MGTVSRITPLRRLAPGQVSRQRVRYLTTGDGAQLAWAEAGAGPILVKASHWLSHLDYDWESPVWKHWTEFLTAHFRLVRHDERGCGLSDWKAGKSSVLRTWGQRVPGLGYQVVALRGGRIECTAQAFVAEQLPGNLGERFHLTRQYAFPQDFHKLIHSEL